jgi:hypothetical protein
MKSTRTTWGFTVVALTEDRSLTGFVVMSVVFERLSLFSALSASGERARLANFLRGAVPPLI